MLSAKTPSLAQRRREAFAESFLSVKPSTRGKPPSPRGTSFSAKASNLVVQQIHGELQYSATILESEPTISSTMNR
jgi:hypothetical protein